MEFNSIIYVNFFQKIYAIEKAGSHFVGVKMVDLPAKSGCNSQ